MADSKQLVRIRDSPDPYKGIHLVHEFESTNGHVYGVCTWFDRIVTTGSKMELFSQHGDPIFGFDEPGQMEGLGLCTLDGQLLVADDKKEEGIRIFDSNYKSIRSVCLKKKSRRICTSPRGLILITTFNNVILIMDRQGHIIGQFGSYGRKDGEFSEPVGICVNSKEEILITDYSNDRIQIFSDHGKILA